MERPNIMGISYLVLSSADLGRWRTFGESMLGMAAHNDGGALILRNDTHEQRLIIEESHDGREALVAIGWEVQGPADLASWEDVLRGAGVTLLEPCEGRAVQGQLCFSDPAGLHHELVWGPATLHAEPFVSPAAISGFVDGVGHVVIRSERQKELQTFLTDVLGFRLTDTSGPAVFLRCGRRHHDIALVPDQITWMHHFMLQVETLDDVGRAFDRAVVGDLLARDLGRHANDRTVSFYFMSPSGFEIEYGYGSRTIGDDWVVTSLDVGDVWGHRVLTAGRPPDERPREAPGDGA